MSRRALLHPVYFGDIAHFATLVRHKKVIWEVCDNFQKQTLRNRMYIFGANGKLMLNIPVKHFGNSRRKTSQTLIENAFEWQSLHWKSICTAYRSAPYFEYYEADFEALYRQKAENLLSWNRDCIALVMRLLKMEISESQTDEYQSIPTFDCVDYRPLAETKKWNFKFATYPQVFHQLPFLSNLSILDLLFNLGPGSVDYLLEISLTPPFVNKQG